MKNEKLKDEKENLRITLSLGLIAIFLTLFFSLNNYWPANSSLLVSWAKAIVNWFFILTAIAFGLFLVFKSISLKYRKPNNLSSFDTYLPPQLAQFFFDLGADFAVFVPIGAAVIVYFLYVPNWLTKTFLLSGLWGKIISSIILFLIIFFISFLMDYFINYKMRGYQ